jgi:GH25 family lysozyme M1 (1,4-beta-N-acetylmuramidase)
MIPQFCDLSQFQPQYIDWQAYKAWSASRDGISRVALRSSYGTGYKDQHFDAYRTGALDAGIDVILYYHYSYPNLNKAQQEANWQHSVVGAIRAQDLLILDIEENVPQATGAWAYAWLAQQESNYGGKLPGIYASSSYIQQRLQDARLARYPLWLANWTFTPDARPSCPAPWTSYQFLQYTDKANGIPGIAGTVDANIFLDKTQPKPEEKPIMIDLNNPTVASHFKAEGAAWKCKDKGHDYTIHGEILATYQKYGKSDLCGLSFLGLPLSNEIPIVGHVGVAYQRFERGVLCFDPVPHAVDTPPGLEKARVYPLHIDSGVGQDPRVTSLQGENAALKALLASSKLGQINIIGKRVQADAQLIIDATQVQ